MWPFASQQDKVTGKFLLDTCGATKQLSWLAKRIEDELGWEVTAMVPRRTEHRVPFKSWCTSSGMVANNALEQVRWDPEELYSFFASADIALLNHELLAVPVRRLFPKLRIVQMCSVSPEPLPLFQAAWDSADLVVAQGWHAASVVDKLTRTRTRVVAWPLAYNEADVVQQSCVRDVDVLFVQRCSVTNYTHHVEFLAAMEYMYGLRVAFTDVTGYLRKTHPHLEYSTAETYKSYLARSRVAVALNDNLYGGLSIREACRAGCTPVVLDALCYRELVGDGYPHLVSDTSPGSLASAVCSAITYPYTVDVSRESYQATWPKVKEDLQRLVS